MPFASDKLFDLSSYQHAALFDGCEHAWEALGALSGYLKQLTLGVIEVGVPEGVVIVNADKVSIGRGSKIEPGAYIKGPCVIGENCEVRQGAYIRGDVIVGRGCVVGHTTEVKHAIFLDGVHAAHFAYVGDSILGNDVNLGAGVKCANVRLDRQEVVVFDGKQRYATGLRKLGAVVGDCCQIGCNSVLNPGTILGQEVVCAPCLAVNGCVPAKHRVTSETKLVQTPFEGVAEFLNRKR